MRRAVCGEGLRVRHAGADAAEHMARLRRLVRYLCGTHDIGMLYAYQDEETVVTVWTDGDWSGDVQVNA